MISAAEAQQLLHQGRVAEAERAFASILEKDPGNVQALNIMALVALREEDLTAALLRIENALRVDAGNPVTLHNRGRIFEAAQRYAEAAASHRAALEVAPNLHAARLHLGRALELAGDSHRAIVCYARALQDAQSDGRWLNKATTPPAFQPLIEHAVRQVRSGRRAAIDELLRSLRNSAATRCSAYIPDCEHISRKSRRKSKIHGSTRRSFTSRTSPQVPFWM
jgi:aspartate beta-hydroxylase